MSSSSQRFVVVAGIDFSDLSLRALDEALEVAGHRRGEVHVVYVEPEVPIDMIPTTGLLQVVDADAALEHAQKCAEERVAAAMTRLGVLPVTRVVVHLRRGSPARELANFAASLDADLVVVGSHGRHGVERLLLGSVAERVVRLARCPVWVVRPKDHAAELKTPEIEPPCPDCLARREATAGAELWCTRHSEHHIRPHRVAYVQDGLYASESVPYGATPGQS